MSKNHNENEEIPTTPFRLIGYNNEYFIAFGKHKLCNNVKTKKEAIQILKDNNWLFLTNVIIAIYDEIHQSLETIKKPENNKYKGLWPE